MQNRKQVSKIVQACSHRGSPAETRAQCLLRASALQKKLETYFGIAVLSRAVASRLHNLVYSDHGHGVQGATKVDCRSGSLLDTL